MLAQKYDDVFNKLDLRYRYREPILQDDFFKRRLLAFINDVREACHPQASTFEQPSEWKFIALVDCATQLMVYGKCQAFAYMAKLVDEKSEPEFYFKNPFLVEAVNRNNLFVIHEQLIQLSNLIQQCHDIKADKIAPNQDVLDKLATYQNRLITLNERIEKLSGEKLGDFKNYLLFLSYYALIGAVNLNIKVGMPNFILVEELIKKAMVESHIAESCQNKQGRNESPIIDFFTFGKGLFARTSYKSFKEARQYLINITSMPPQQQTTFFNLARNRFMEENKYSDFEKETQRPKRSEP